jgi:hypothetical protein
MLHKYDPPTESGEIEINLEEEDIDIEGDD